MKTALATLALATTTLPLAAASPPPSDYQSSTATYIPYREAGLVDWRMANAALGHGQMGHRGQMREAPADPAMGRGGSRPDPSYSPGMDGHEHSMGGKR